MAFSGPEFKAGPATFASADLLSCWFKRIKHPRLSLILHLYRRFKSEVNCYKRDCFWEGAGLASALFRVAASATSIPSPLKPSGKCKCCWSKGQQHAGGDVLRSAVVKRLKMQKGMTVSSHCTLAEEPNSCPPIISLLIPIMYKQVLIS